MSLPGKRYIVAFTGNKKDIHIYLWKTVEGWVVRDLHTKEEFPCGSRWAAVTRAREMNASWDAQ